jgi:hypothetical protein
LVVRGQKRYGFEFKLSESAGLSKSMHVALADLRLDRLDVVHGGTDTYPLTDKVRGLALQRVLTDLEPLR